MDILSGSRRKTTGYCIISMCEFWVFFVRTDKFLATVGLNCRKYLSGHFRQDKAPTQIDKNLSDQYLSGQTHLFFPDNLK